MKSWSSKFVDTTLDEAGYQTHACNCIGPQNGEKYCPCRMRGKAAEKAALRKEIIEELKRDKRIPDDIQ